MKAQASIAAMPLPAPAGDVSTAWLEQAVQEQIPGARIHAITLDDTWQGTATKLRVKVEANDGDARFGHQ